MSIEHHAKLMWDDLTPAEQAMGALGIFPHKVRAYAEEHELNQHDYVVALMAQAKHPLQSS